MLISIVIPVYRSTTSLVELATRIDRVFSSLESDDYEIVFVNDSPSWSETSETLQKLAENSSRIAAIELMKNFGQQPATLCGIEYARGDFIVTMDDDLQHAPEDIPELLEQSAHDAVIASFSSKKHSAFKRMASALKGYFDRIILGKPKGLVLSPFRLIRAPIAKLMLHRTTPYPFIPALLFEITHDVVNVQVEHYQRGEGRSHYTLAKMLKLFSNLVINNSSLLLRAVGIMGFAIAFAAFAYAVAIVARGVFFDLAVVGWASTMTAILFFGGLTMLTLGIVGEYLIRIIATTEQRPTYCVRQIYPSDRA